MGTKYENLYIENGTKCKCPNCRNIFLIKNDRERLFRKTSLIHENTETGKLKVKCRNCNQIFEFNS